MPIYNGNTKVNVSGIDSVYVGSTKVYASAPPVPTTVLVYIFNNDTLNSHSVTINGVSYNMPKATSGTYTFSFPVTVNCSRANDFRYNGTHGTVSGKEVTYVAQYMTSITIRMGMSGINSVYTVTDA